MRIRSNLQEIIKTYIDKSEMNDLVFCKYTNKAIAKFYLDEYKILFGKDKYYKNYLKELENDNIC